MLLINNQLKSAGITTAALYAAAYALRSASIELKYFAAAEFGVWWPLMDTDLLLNLDTLRGQLNTPIIISPAIGATGRMYNTGSQHFPRPNIKAVDVMLPNFDQYTAYKKIRALELFNGIGVYPDWKPHKGFHLDMRSDKTALAPALWSGINIKTADNKNKQVYKGVNEAFV